MNIIYKLLLTLNSTSLIIVVFLIKEQRYFCSLESYPRCISYLIYLLIPIVLSGISICMTKFLSTDSIEGEIDSVEHANNMFIPTYLGYFFVALSVPSFETLVIIFLIIFIFTYYSQTSYFNPLFLIFGYNFYYIITRSDKMKVFLITKQLPKSSSELILDSLKRINNFTYINK